MIATDKGAARIWRKHDRERNTAAQGTTRIRRKCAGWREKRWRMDRAATDKGTATEDGKEEGDTTAEEEERLRHHRIHDRTMCEAMAVDLWGRDPHCVVLAWWSKAPATSDRTQEW